ncbi:hypothetical protein LCGC14_0642150 [marine sediment metagenome]|uniref:Uncharacterized protein n=1 Tax=marine sediment metagenome TaxID=412755 RepID=A0A0F9U790_9ZZZZ
MCDRCSDLERLARNRLDKIEKLEDENWSLRSKLENAEYKIRRELEPRIAREKRGYDLMLSDPHEAQEE